MKTLILIRHAKSSWKDASLDDIDRPLNKRGKRDAPLMGKKLGEKKIKPDLILTSPAKRALKTAILIAAEIEFPKKKIRVNPDIYFGELSEQLTAVREIKNKHKLVLFIGHNPCITDLANALTASDTVNIPTCGMIQVEMDVDSWAEVNPGAGRMIFFDYPKKYAR